MVADDEATRIARVGGFSDDIVAAFFAKRLLGLPGRRALGDRINTKGQNAGETGFVFEVEGMAHGDARLFHGCGGECGKADHIPSGVDVRDIRLIMFIDLQKTALVG